MIPFPSESFWGLEPQLESARIKVFLEHQSEAAFWQAYFPRKDKVLFSDFIKALWRNTMKKNINTAKGNSFIFEKTLEHLISSEKNEVSLASYRKLIEWFGPINEKVFFEDFRNIMVSDWFFPDLRSGVDADGIMYQKGGEITRQLTKGTFLVRLTARQEEKSTGERKLSPFTLTFVDEKGVVHSRVPKISSGYGFSWNDHSFKHHSLLGLIELLKTNLPTYFSTPLPKTNYSPRYRSVNNKI